MEKDEMYRKALQNGGVNLAKGMEHTHINVNEVVLLVYNSATSQRHLALKIPAKELLISMSESVWDIVAGPHQSDGNQENRNVDKTKHITIRFSNRSSYHLRMDSRNYLFQIKKAKNGYIESSVVHPWEAPGTLHK